MMGLEALLSQPKGRNAGFLLVFWCLPAVLYADLFPVSIVVFYTGSLLAGAAVSRPATASRFDPAGCARALCGGHLRSG